jgi:hypothetical protein
MVIAVTGKIRPYAVKDIHLQLRGSTELPGLTPRPHTAATQAAGRAFSPSKFERISDFRRNSTF